MKSSTNRKTEPEFCHAQSRDAPCGALLRAAPRGTCRLWCRDRQERHTAPRPVYASACIQLLGHQTRSAANPFAVLIKTQMRGKPWWRHCFQPPSYGAKSRWGDCSSLAGPQGTDLGWGKLSWPRYFQRIKLILLIFDCLFYKIVIHIFKNGGVNPKFNRKLRKEFNSYTKISLNNFHLFHISLIIDNFWDPFYLFR